MKYYVVAGWSEYKNKVVYFHLGDQTEYTGWSEHYTDATIFDERLFEFAERAISKECVAWSVGDLKKIEVKLGEWENLYSKEK